MEETRRGDLGRYQQPHAVADVVTPGEGRVDGGLRERLVHQSVKAFAQPSADRVGPFGAAVALDVDPDDPAVDRLLACDPLQRQQGEHSPCPPDFSVAGATYAADG